MKKLLGSLLVALALAFLLLPAAHAFASGAVNTNSYCWQLYGNGDSSWDLRSRGCEPYNGGWTKAYFTNQETYHTYQCENQAYNLASNNGQSTRTIINGLASEGCQHQSNGSYYKP